MGVEEKSTHTHIKKQRERRTECWEFERGFCLLFRNIHSLPILISFLSIYLFFSYYFLTFQFSLSLSSLSDIFQIRVFAKIPIPISISLFLTNFPNGRFNRHLSCPCFSPQRPHQEKEGKFRNSSSLCLFP